MRSSFVKSLLSSGAILPLMVGTGVMMTAAFAMSASARAETVHVPSFPFEQIAEGKDAPPAFMRGGHEYNVVNSTFDGNPARQNFIKLEPNQYRFYPDPVDNPGTFYAPKGWPFKDSEIIKDVQVEGVDLLAEGFAKRYILGEDHAQRVRPGQPFNYDLFVLAVTSLFATGLYWEIVVHREGDTLVVNAIESPVVRGQVVGREDLMSAEEKAALEAQNKLTKKEANALYHAVLFKMIEKWETSGNEVVSEYTEWKRYNVVPFHTDAFVGDYYINLYSNDKVEEWGNFDRMPAGTILVLDSFHGDANRTGSSANWKAGELIIMEKMEKGFNAATGDWKFTRIDDKGKAQDITKEKGVRAAYLVNIPDEYKKKIYF